MVVDEIVLSCMLLKHQYDFVYNEKVKPYGVTFIQAIYLREIYMSNGVITLSALAKRYDVTRARVSTVLKGVRENGFLKETPIDGRTNALSLTEDGIRFVQEFDKMVEADYDRVFGSFSQEELMILHRAIQKAVEGFKGMSSKSKKD